MTHKCVYVRMYNIDKIKSIWSEGNDAGGTSSTFVAWYNECLSRIVTFLSEEFVQMKVINQFYLHVFIYACVHVFSSLTCFLQSVNLIFFLLYSHCLVMRGHLSCCAV